MKHLLLILVSICGLYVPAQNRALLKPQEFEGKLKNTHTIVLDVRTPEEYNTGHIENAIILDYRNPDFSKQIKKLDSTQTYLVYCRSGRRSAATIDSLRNAGFKNLYDLEGGIIAWNKNNLPLTDLSSDLISLEKYNELIKSDEIVLIDFFAPWCGPCLKMEPMFAKLKEQYKDKITIIKINADENKMLSKSFTQKGFPVLIAYKKEEIQWERIGLLEEQEVINLIENLLK